GGQKVGARIPVPNGGTGFRDLHPGVPLDVVGIVDDMRQESVEAPPQPEMFVSIRQTLANTNLSYEPILVVRTASDPLVLVPALRVLVRGEAPDAALDSVMTMENRVMTSLARPRTYAMLLGAFAALAVLINAVGLYGVLSYTVAQRSREFGVRTALGAQISDIIGLVLRQALVMASEGVIGGLVVAAAAVRWLSSFLYGVAAYDPVTFVAVPLILVVVVGVACAVPV